MVVIKEEDEQNKEDNPPIQPTEQKELSDNNGEANEANDDKEKV